MTRFACALLAVGLAACTTEAPTAPDSGAADADASDAGIDGGPGYRVFFGEGIDAEIEAQFASAPVGPVAPPEIVYPETGTLVPPNTIGVDIHFRAAVVQAFEVMFAQGGEPSVVAYVRCAAVGEGCVFQPWSEVWRELASRRGGGAYEIRIRGLAGGMVTAASAPVVLELAEENIEGGLYYFAPEDHPPSIRRHELGLERRSSEVFLQPRDFVASHAVSRDGARITISTLTDVGGSTSTIYDVVTRAPIGVIESTQGLVARYGPGTDMLLSAQGADVPDAFPIQIVSEDGTVLRTFELGAAHSADWSPDGERIVFDRTTELVGFQFRYELQVLERSGGDWLPPRAIATPDILAPYSPTFAPDSDWLGFTGLDTTDREPGTGTFAPLIVALRVSDGRMVHLDRALGTPDRHTEVPSLLRWNPNPYMHDGRRIFWFTFSSARECGFLPAVDHEFAGGRQVWMAAFDPEADPDDPSRPAFRVPAQRWGLDNGMAEWALGVRRQPCENDEDCPVGEMCLDGFCYEAPE